MSTEKDSNKHNLEDSHYRIWRKNTKELYDMVYTQKLKYPSSSLEWFPDAYRTKEFQTSQRLLLSTHSKEQECENIQIASVVLPDMAEEDTEEQLPVPQIEFKIKTSIPLPVSNNHLTKSGRKTRRYFYTNKISYSPLAANIIACKTEYPEILVYDYTNHSSMDSKKGPDRILCGHKDGGSGLCWNPSVYSELLSAGKDKKIILFDINKGELISYMPHMDVVNDVKFSVMDTNMFVSVSDDRSIVIYDRKSPERGLRIENAHMDKIKSCVFSNFQREILATGSDDKTIRIWDIRNMTSPISILMGHRNNITSIKWSPHFENILASSSKDSSVILWDLNRIEFPSDKLYGREMLFRHMGHIEEVRSFSWNPIEPFEIASTSVDGILQIWRISA